MRIKLDDTHTLCSDRWCCWVIEERANKKTGELYEVRVSGYHRNFETLVESYIEAEFMGTEAESVKDLAKQLKALKKEVRGWNKQREDS